MTVFSAYDRNEARLKGSCLWNEIIDCFLTFRSFGLNRKLLVRQKFLQKHQNILKILQASIREYFPSARNDVSCRCVQSILFHCIVTLHVSGAFHTHHQEYINCIYTLRYRSYIGAATFLQRGRVQTRWRKVAAPMYDLYRRV